MSNTTDKYFEGVGRRKESVARVRISSDTKAGFVVNEKKAEEFFPLKDFQNTIFAPLEAVGLTIKVSVSVKVNGGGVRGQADAIKLGLARALVKYNDDFQRTLKDLDYF